MFYLKSVMAVPYYKVQIGLHELEHEVDVLVIFCAEDLVELDHILVVELLEKHYLAVGALRIGRVLESIEDLLEGQHFLGFLVFDLPDLTVGSATDFLDDLIPFEDVFLYLHYK